MKVRIGFVPCLLLVSLFLALPLIAYQPSSTSPYTFSGTSFCTNCETFSHDKVGDGFHHDPGCGQSGSPLYFCDCSIGYSAGLMLQQPILRVIDSTTVELEYFARNAYCNPPADGGNINEPNAIPNFINVNEIDPVTLATISTKHVVPPYWEHGKIRMTDMNPGCKMYRAIYFVMDTSSNIYAVSSDIVGGTGSTSCTAIRDLGPCPTCNGGSGPSGGVSPGAGGPINVGSGNMYYSMPLFRVDEPGGPLDFTVTYNSVETNAGALGPGFTHSFATSMTSTTGSSGVRLWRMPDGTRVLFARENHPPIGEYWRPIYPGETTGSINHDTSAGRYKYTALNGTVTEVDDGSAGLWRKTTDRWGNTLTATYTGSNLTTITDTLGRTWTLGYSGSLLTSITDNDSNQWRFSYDSSNRLEKIFDPLHTGTTPWRQFTWTTYATGKSAVALISDDSGAVLEGHQYDSSGRATSSWSGDTVSGSAPSPGTNARDLVTLSYDSPTQTTVTTKIDSGVTQSSVYTLTVGHGRFLASSVVGSCGSCGATEDAQAFTFDDENHVLTKTVGLDKSGSGGTDERVTSSFTYDANGNVLTATMALGKTEEHTTTFAYGKSNWPDFVTSITEASVAKSGQSKTTTFSWNTAETQLTTTRSGYQRSTDSSATSYVTTSIFDSKHRLTEVDGPRTNEKTTRTYYSDTDTTLDRRGRLQQVASYVTTSATLTSAYDNYDIYGTAKKITDANGVDPTLTLDARGRTLTSTSVKPSSDSSEPADYVSTFAYDSRDRLTSALRPSGNGVRYRYEDGTNRLLETIRINSSGNEYERRLLALNTIGRPTSDSAQDCATPANPCASWTTRRSEAFAYDTSGRLSTRTHPDSTFVSYAYDSRGNLLSTQDERHSAPNALQQYDFRNRLKQVTQKRTIVTGSDVVTQYAYDDQSNLTSVTDPNGNVTTYGFDDFGRMQTQVSPVTGTTSNVYDEDGNVTSTTDANGAVTTRTYDLLRRLTGASTTRSSSTEAVSWTYDDSTAGYYGKGHVASMTDPTGSTAYRYDRRGILRHETKTIEGNVYTTQYGHDANGNETSITYPSGRVVTYAFDFADRPSSATAGSTAIVSSAAYLPFGPAKQLVFGNGTTKTATYDSRYQPMENKLTTTSATLADYNYAEDAAGNITQIHDATSSAYNRDFAYDDLNRLVTANSGSSLWGSGSYSYDAMGNMTALTLGSAHTASFSYSSTLPKLTSVTENSVSRSVSYDSVGNETAVGSGSFAYTPRNSLRTGDGYSYEYDGRGVRTISVITGNSISALSVPSTVAGGSSDSGTVTLYGLSSPGTTTVSLSSSNATALPVPSTVTVAAGQSTATFSFTSNSVSSSTSVTICATSNVTVCGTVTVLPAPAISSIALTPSALVPGLATASGTVTLASAAPAALNVTLATSPSGLASVPATVHVNASATTGTFTLTPLTGVATATTVTTTATLGTSSTNTTITFNPPIANSITVPSTINGLSMTPLTVNVQGYPVTGGTLTVTSNTPSVIGSTTVTQSGSGYSGTITASNVSSATTVVLSVTSGGATVTATVTVQPCSVSPATPTVPSGDDVWVDDEWPEWAVTAEGDDTPSNWDSSQHATGSYSLDSFNASGWHGVGFGASVPNQPLFGPDETLVLYALINNCGTAPGTMYVNFGINYAVSPTPPAGNFLYYWGDAANLPSISSTIIRVGDMPAAGQWVRLEVPLTALAAGGRLTSMYMAVYDGEVWWDHIGVAAGPAPARISDATVPASPQPYGSGLTWNLSALGGTPPIQYRFERLDGSTWTTVQSYSSTHTYTWTPSSGDVGSHSVRVSVRNSGVTADSEDSRTYPITISSMGGLLRTAPGFAPTSSPASAAAAHSRALRAPLVLSLDAGLIADSSPGDARRYSFYTPGMHLLSETLLTTASAPTPAYDYVWFNAMPVGQIDIATSTTHWTFTDHLGTPILQTNASAAIDWRAEYEPFGTVFAFRTGATRRQPLRLPGQEAEQADGDGSLVSERSYNIFRWYRSGWGRYTQSDPLDLNLYSMDAYLYVGANPVRRKDPVGLFAIDKSCSKAPFGSVGGAFGAMCKKTTTDGTPCSTALKNVSLVVSGNDSDLPNCFKSQCTGSQTTVKCDCEFSKGCAQNVRVVGGNVITIGPGGSECPNGKLKSFEETAFHETLHSECAFGAAEDDMQNLYGKMFKYLEKKCYGWTPPH